MQGHLETFERLAGFGIEDAAHLRALQPLFLEHAAALTDALLPAHTAAAAPLDGRPTRLREVGS